MGVVTIKAAFEGLGWQVRLQQKRSQYFLTLVKEIALGSALKRGDPIFYYLIDCGKRKALLVFLDGKERPTEDSVKLKGISFLVKG